MTRRQRTLRRDIFRIAKTKSEPLDDYLSYASSFSRDNHTIFGKHQAGLLYDYSDRLVGDRYFEALKLADEKDLPKKTVKRWQWWQFILSHVTGQKCNIKHIYLTLNVGNGQSLMVFGYRYREATQNG